MRESSHLAQFKRVVGARITRYGVESGILKYRFSAGEAKLTVR
jgi:hypothetical protein